jgi:hypothetical protein
VVIWPNLSAKIASKWPKNQVFAAPELCGDLAIFLLEIIIFAFLDTAPDSEAKPPLKGGTIFGAFDYATNRVLGSASFERKERES